MREVGSKRSLGSLRPDEMKTVHLTKDHHEFGLEVRRVAEDRVTIVVRSHFADEARTLVGVAAFVGASDKVSSEQKELKTRDGTRHFAVILSGSRGDVDQSLVDLADAVESGKFIETGFKLAPITPAHSSEGINDPGRKP